MTAVVVAAVPVSHSPSAPHISAHRLSSNVAFYVSSPSSFYSNSFKLLSWRKNGRFSKRRLLEAAEGSSFLCFATNGLSYGLQRSEGKQLASRQNGRFTRANNEQGEGSKILWVFHKGKRLWVLQKRQARDVTASAMHRSRGSKFSEFSYLSDSHDIVADDQDTAWRQQRRKWPDERQYAGSMPKKLPRAPLPTQNQQYRLHNEVTMFESIRQPRALGRPDDYRAHNCSLPGHAGDLSSLKQKGSELSISRLNFRQNHQKGGLFTSKLGEVLTDLEKKNNFIKQSVARKGDSGSLLHTVGEEKKSEVDGVGFSSAEGARLSDLSNFAEDAPRTTVEGNQRGEEGEGNLDAVITRKNIQSVLGPSRLSMQKTARGDEAGFTSFNLFSSSPTVSWEADRSRSLSFKPTLRNRRSIRRPLPTSIGSRSSPSQRSVTKRNKGHPSSQAEAGVGGNLEVNKGGEAQRRICSNDPIRHGERVETQVGSQSQAQRLAEQVESNQNMDSQAARGVTGALEFGKREKLMEPGSTVKNDMFIQEAWSLKINKRMTPRTPSKKSSQSLEQVEGLFDWSDSDVEGRMDCALSTDLITEKVMPSNSSPVSSCIYGVHNHSYSDSEDDDYESSLDAEGNASFQTNGRVPSLFVQGDSLVLPGCEDNLPTQSNISEHAGDKVSAVLPDAEDYICTSGSAKVEGRNACDTTQVNSSERCSANTKQEVASRKIFLEHASSATPAMDASSDAFYTCDGGSSPTSETWHKHNLRDLPFEFQFSYTETPKKPILGYRETPFSPFGPSTMGRPWIGNRPLKPSKKKKRVFDSFKPPPKDLKGVKFVQDPGPFPEGQGPRAAKSREEIMGEPLTKKEIVYLVEKCKREKRQLNLGRDGLTHNMLDLIHSYWKRRRVCRIKCKGVPTVDMENVKFQIEDKTGGKVIYHAGGVLYLFRGRNYNYKDRPIIPLMLWKPPTPVYPQLIQSAPEGLTKGEADRLRRLGRKVEPICKLGKNGVYLTLVDEVRAAFGVDELVRVDCQGLNPSDYKKIGAKLRDLVPCVLLSFDKEHILMWKGKKDSSVEGTSVLEAPDSELTPDNKINDADVSNLSDVEGEEKLLKPSALAHDFLGLGDASIPLTGVITLSPKKIENSMAKTLPLELVSKAGEHERRVMGEHVEFDTSAEELTNFKPCEHEETEVDHMGADTLSEAFNNSVKSALSTAYNEEVSTEVLLSGPSMHKVGIEKDGFDSSFKAKCQLQESHDHPLEYVVDIDGLWEHAFQSGMAIKLSAENMDSDQIIRKADELAQSAPLAPTYTTKFMYKIQLKRDPDYKPADVLQIHFGRVLSKPKKVVNKRKSQLPTVGVLGMGGLPVDELAKLLIKQ